MPNSKQILKALKKADAAGNEADARKLAKMYKKAVEIESRPEINNLAEGTRKVAQGLTFGFADEIEAGVRTAAQDESMKYGLASTPPQQQSPFNMMIGGNINPNFQSKEEYKKIRNQLRSQGDEFTRQNPVLSPALEIVGGITSPLALTRALGKQAITQATKKLPSFVKGTTGQGVGYGTLYGAGTANELSDVPQDALFGAGLGGVGSKLISGAGKVIAPKVSNLVKKTMSRGNNLTPGQMFGGIANTLEQKFGSVIPGIKTARSRTIEKFNKEVAEDILKPIGVVLPPSIKSNSQASQFITKEISKSYNDAYNGMKLNMTPEFKQSLKEVVKNSGLIGKSKQKLNSEINKIINTINNKSVKGSGKNKKTIINGIKGENIKNVSKNIKQRIAAFRKSTNTDESPLENPLRDVATIFKNNMVKQNPINGKKLLDTDAVYGKVVSFQTAVGKGTKTGLFSPNQLNLSATEGANAISKRISKANQTGVLQKIANEAEEVLGDFVPDSGTAGNLAINSVVAGFIDPLVLGGFLTAEMAYSKPIIKLVNQYVRSGGSRQGLRKFLESYSPTAGLLSSQQFNQEQ
jgi:hypothetical protein|tara:strand:+ start:1034 stop:2770 length:1737 start_codon:yes stop_codon:yes gene_type:complete